MKKRKREHDSFTEYILNDDKFVMKFLIILSQGFSLLIFLFLLFMGILYRNWLIIGIFGTMFALAVYKVYQFYFVFGGVKTMTGLSASSTIWNKDKILIKRKKK
jgi:hypothetical protein